MASTFENDIVLDCFAGSGSTLIAALKTGRYSVGVEIDENWCKAIKDRLEIVGDIDFRQLEGYKLMKGTATRKKKKETVQIASFF